MPKPVATARAAALNSGARHYDGNACTAGHTLRHTISGACVACQAKAQRQRRRAQRATIHDDVLG
ncbi:MAG: hypothetical protein ABIS14_12725 [Sphingomonas sp.]